MIMCGHRGLDKTCNSRRDYARRHRDFRDAARAHKRCLSIAVGLSYLIGNGAFAILDRFKLLREYKPQVAVLAEAASRVPSGLWDEGVEVSEVKAKLDADPYTRAVLSAATATQLADHGRFDAGGVANIRRLLTSVPEDLIIEFTGPKSR